ncbi:MAG: hypothetical protein PW791_15740 [Neorhizobium sp.]|jgi:hypothetical protein|nr:hypothetical protein [Neorhizobium sp.]
MAEKRSAKLKRLVDVQRHLEKLAEYELADTTARQAELAETMERTMSAMVSLDEHHRVFARNYAANLSKLEVRNQQLKIAQQLQEQKILKEKTKGDRLDDRRAEAAQDEDREAQDEAVYNLVELALLRLTSASAKLNQE